MIRDGIKSDLTLYTSVNLINIDDKYLTGYGGAIKNKIAILTHGKMI